MDKLRITGGQKLEGTIRVSGAKNSTLPAMAASLLTADEVLLTNIPLVADIRTTRRLLGELGVRVEFEDGHAVRARAEKITSAASAFARAASATRWLTVSPIVCSVSARLPPDFN